MTSVVFVMLLLHPQRCKCPIRNNGGRNPKFSHDDAEMACHPTIAARLGGDFVGNLPTCPPLVAVDPAQDLAALLSTARGPWLPKDRSGRPLGSSKP